MIYPGLASHPQHALARRQMNGFGGMVSAVLAGGVERCAAVSGTLPDSSRWPKASAASRASIEHPALMTHASIPPEKRAAIGIDDGLVRLSVGVEDVGRPDRRLGLGTARKLTIYAARGRTQH